MGEQFKVKVICWDHREYYRKSDKKELGELLKHDPKQVVIDDDGKVTYQFVPAKAECWESIYDYYAKSKTMKYLVDYLEQQPSWRKLYIGLFDEFKIADIKDLWGYIMPFANYMGYDLIPNDGEIWKRNKNGVWEDIANTKNRSMEKNMLWCTTKFFEFMEKDKK